MTKLLVSVRNAAEARTALAGGADIIDVKEPSRGSLGCADDEVIRQVMQEVAGRAPVSAARGELVEHPPPAPAGLSFVKVGLADFQNDWLEPWLRWRKQHPHSVLVAYADVHELETFVDIANDVTAAALLFDTQTKDGRTLMDFISVERLASLRQRCEVPFAVSGSLSTEHIDSLTHIRPDIFAVRGAVCAGRREGNVDESLVRALAIRVARAWPTD